MEYLGVVIVVIFRLLVPLTIPRWPFWGAIAALIADGMDSKLLIGFGWEHNNGLNYQSLDKILDTYYLAFEWVVVLKMQNPLVRRTLSGLFIWRAIGVALFEITRLRYILLFAPNFFEYAYLPVMAVKKFSISRITTKGALVGSLVFIGPFKVAQEYIMHYKEIPLGLGTIFKYLMSLF